MTATEVGIAGGPASGFVARAYTAYGPISLWPLCDAAALYSFCAERCDDLMMDEPRKSYGSAASFGLISSTAFPPAATARSS